MSMRIVERGCLILACVLIVPSLALGAPIVKIEVLVREDVYLVPGHLVDVLTPEALATLAELDDQGWHVGWFKKKLREDVDIALVGPISAGAGGANDVSLLPLNSSDGVLNSSDAVVESTVAPSASTTTDDVLHFVPMPSAPSTIESAESNAARTVVPEPASLALVGIGIAGIGMRKWRQRR